MLNRRKRLVEHEKDLLKSLERYISKIGKRDGSSKRRTEETIIREF